MSRCLCESRSRPRYMSKGFSSWELSLSHLSRCSRDLSRSLSRRLCESRSRFLSSSLLPNSLSSSPGLSLPCLPIAPGKPSRNPGGNPRPMPGSQCMPGGGAIIGWNGWLGSASNHGNHLKRVLMCVSCSFAGWFVLLNVFNEFIDG